MTVKDIGVSLTGSDALVQWFGNWPSFQDAEVICLSMARTGESRLRVYPYYPDKPATVDFVLEEITEGYSIDIGPLLRVGRTY
jgi:hypothetical protein